MYKFIVNVILNKDTHFSNYKYIHLVLLKIQIYFHTYIQTRAALVV